MAAWRAIWLACVVLAAPAASAASDRDAIVTVLEASGAAWSAGDLDGFMASYEESPDILYVGNKGLVRGYDAIRAMYAARFGASAETMGRLRLTTLDERPLGPDYALVTGRYRLEMAADAAGGVFTLVWHHSAAGWRIISDHSSSD